MNTDLLRTINGWSGNSVLDPVMRFAAGQLIFVAFAVVAGLCVLQLRSRHLAPVLLVGTSLVVAFGAGRVAGMLFPEQRPFTKHPELHQLLAHEPGQSFPSDHALAAFALAFAAIAFLSRRWGAGLVAAAALIAFSRVYSGVHYPGDVLGSAAIAGLAVALVAVASTHIHVPTPTRHRAAA